MTDSTLKAYGKMISKGLDIFIIIFAIMVVGSMFFSNLTGHPVLFSYTMTNSMEPTIDQGDMFFIVPNIIHEPRENDIIVFEEIYSNKFIVHRVIGVNENGEYYTKGDNSIFSDQQADFSTIDRSKVIGTVFSPFNRTITIPEIGNIINNISGMVSRWYMLMVAAIAILIFLSLKPHTRFKTTNETHVRMRHVFILCTAFILLWSTIILIISSQTISTRYLVTDTPITESEVLPGQTFEMEYSIERLGFIPTTIFMTPLSDNSKVDKSSKILFGGSYTGKMTIVAPEDAGFHYAKISVRAYLPIMPTKMIEKLYEMHYLIPIIVSDLILLIPLLSYYLLYCDGNQYIFSSFRKFKWNKRFGLSGGLIK